MPEHYIALKIVFWEYPIVAVMFSCFYIAAVTFILKLLVAPFYWQRVVSELKNLTARKKSILKDMDSFSIIIPAYNEEKTILQTVFSCVAQAWQPEQIVIVDDGSTDDTSQLLIAEFGFTKVTNTKNGLYKKISKLAKSKLVGSRVVEIWASGKIILVRTVNGGKGKAMNTGLLFCTAPYVCVLDADTIPDRRGFELLIAPMVKDKTVALTSGRNQFINGCRVERGGVVKSGFSKNPLLISQTVEFFKDLAVKALRNSFGAQTVLVGNFSAYRVSEIENLGGFAGRGLTEDYDYNLEVHRQRLKGRNLRAISVLNARGWTQAPYSISGFFSQRSRWGAGVLDSMIRQRDIVFNRKAGLFGMVFMPLQWLRVITFTFLFWLNYIVLPTIIYLSFTDPFVAIIFKDIILFFYLPVFIYQRVIEFSLMIAVDWKYIRSYNKLSEYFFLMLWNATGGLIYEELRGLSMLSGYFKTLLGTAKWGKSERTKVD